jgi:hypothetical protein
MRSLPIKRLVGKTGFVRDMLRCKAYNGTRLSGPGCGSSGGRNRILAVLMGMVPNGRDGGWQGDNNNLGMITAQGAVATLLAKGAINCLCEALRL